MHDLYENVINKLTVKLMQELRESKTYNSLTISYCENQLYEDAFL